MKLLASSLLGIASLAVATAMAALPAPGDGTFANGGAQCKALPPQTCGTRFAGKLLPGAGQPRYYAYASELAKDPNYDPCALFNDACTGRLSKTAPLVHFGCQPFDKSPGIAAAYCAEYQVRGSALDVTSVTGTAAGLQQVQPKPTTPGKGPACNEIQKGWCVAAVTDPFILADPLP